MGGSIRLLFASRVFKRVCLLLGISFLLGSLLQGLNNASAYSVQAEGDPVAELIRTSELHTGAYSEYKNAVADSDGNTYVVGFIGDRRLEFDSGVTVTAGYESDCNALIVKYDSTGKVLWANSTVGGAAVGSFFYGVGLDPSGNPIAVGEAYLNTDNDKPFGFGNSVTLSLPVGGDGIMVKYDANSGKAQWAQSMKANAQSKMVWAKGVDIDSSGNIYVGIGASTNVSIDFGNSVTLSDYSGGAFVQYNSEGVAQWVVEVGDVQLNAIKVDASNNIYVAGDAVFAKYNSSGTAQWTKNYATTVRVESIATDSLGNIYVAGHTEDTFSHDLGNGVTVAGAYHSPTNGPDYNVLLAKYSSSGVAQWAKSTATAPNYSKFLGVSVDSTGKVYASGVIYGSGNFNFGDSVVIAGPYTRYNLLLVQYNSTDGETQWAKSALSGLDESQYSAVVVDSSDNINVVGTIKEDGEGFDLGNNVSVFGGYGDSPLFACYNSSGVAQFASSSVLTNGSLWYDGIATDAQENVYLAGTQSGRRVDLGNGVGITAPYSGGDNMALVKYSAQGVAQWAVSAVVAPRDSSFVSVDVDNSGNVYAAGYISGASVYDFGNNVTVNGAYSNNRNAVLVKYNSEGVAQWAVSTNTAPHRSLFSSIKTDALGNVYVAGSIYGAGEYRFSADIAVQGSSTSYNAVLVKYNSLGEVQWARSNTAGTNTSEFKGLAIDSNNNIFVAGYVNGNGQYQFGNNVTVGGSSTGSNAVLVKYNSEGVAQWAYSATVGADSSMFEGISINNDDDIFVSGIIYGTGDHQFGSSSVVNGAYTGDNALIVKYNTSGEAQWARSTTAGLNNSYFYNIATDANGNVFAVGYIQGNGNFDFGNNIVIAGSYSKYTNFAIVKYDSSGAARWGRSATLVPEENIAINSWSSAIYECVSIDRVGNIYVAAWNEDIGLFDFGDGVVARAGGGDWQTNPLLVKYTIGGTFDDPGGDDSGNGDPGGSDPGGDSGEPDDEKKDKEKEKKSTIESISRLTILPLTGGHKLLIKH